MIKSAENPARLIKALATATTGLGILAFSQIACGGSTSVGDAIADFVGPNYTLVDYPKDPKCVDTNARNPRAPVPMENCAPDYHPPGQ